MYSLLQEKIKNEYELILNQQKSQFEALQSQIRPHFIINTIYGFITLNQIGEKKLLNDYLYSFTHLLRYVLLREDMTTLGNELQFLENYCSLQHLRFGHRMNYNIQCPSEFHSFEIPKLLLQPLVENAVVHGIEPCVNPCTLSISVEKHCNSIYIIIEDKKFDMLPVVEEEIMLEMPSRTLCKEDCRGLCQKCGKNLNEGDCDCDKKEVDPRLAILKTLLQ